jgi:hypothetical protein
MQVAGIVGLIYCSWAIGQFFEKTKMVNYLKAFAAYVFGMITFTFMAMFVGFVIEWVIES